MRLSGVTEAMLRQAYPCGVPDTSFSGTVDLVSDEEEDVKIKTEIKQEEEWLFLIISHEQMFLSLFTISLCPENKNKELLWSRFNARNT